MNRYSKIILGIMIVITRVATGAEIKIGLFYGTHIESMVFTTIEGEYLLYGDGQKIAVIGKGVIFHIENSASGLEVHDTAGSFGSFKELIFKGVSNTNIFQVKPVFPALPAKESEDDLTVRFDGSLTMINNLEIEKYIPGTVETEGGSSALPEYYKAQAVIARTFALKNILRHAHEGFNLCDGVHCQAYNGKSRMNKEIYKATRSTENEILIDFHGEPVMTAYHANCGGITGNASAVWNRDLYYLIPVNDPFCNRSSHTNWTKTITRETWNEYLIQKNLTVDMIIPVSQAVNRQKYLDPQNQRLLLTDIRKDLGLKSSFFTIVVQDTSVVIRGHGYGHGLGLCQQGAMEMARVGFTYIDILMFYFTNLNLNKKNSFLK
jgi:stage II sporulation protein D